jgi:glutaredoxin-like protein
MPVLKPSLQRQLRAALATLTSPVTLAVFIAGDGDASTCDMCDDTRQLVEELAWQSDGKVSVEVHDLAGDAEAARRYAVERVPAVVVLGGGAERQDFGIRFFGIPSGYEFATLVEDIKMVSAAVAPDLTPQTLDALSRLSAPLHLQVFVTPTCPYCPQAVLLAHKLALASPWVTADMVDASEFPDLADRHRVHAVPRTVINDTVHIEGAVPEAALVAELRPMLEARR